VRIHPVRLPPLLGILQNRLPPLRVGEPPLLDLFQGSEAAQAGQVIA
jgi:hypothetical protein